SFNFFSFSFFKHNIRNQMIDYNQLNMDNTVENYENHFNLIKNTAYSLMLSNPLQMFHIKMFQYNEIDYATTKEVVQEISQKIVNNPNLFIENILIYYKQPSFIIERFAASDAQTAFNSFYQ